MMDTTLASAMKGQTESWHQLTWHTVSMPVVLRIGPYTFFFYSLENNEPPHIHIRRDRTLAKFWLEPVSLAYNKGYPLHEARHLRRLVEEHRELLLRSWHEYFTTRTQD